MDVSESGLCLHSDSGTSAVLYSIVMRISEVSNLRPYPSVVL